MIILVKKILRQEKEVWYEVIACRVPPIKQLVMLSIVSVFGVSLSTELHKLTKRRHNLCNGVWLTHSDINKVKVISELLCISHSYVNLECFNSEDIDFMMEFTCTDKA